MGSVPRLGQCPLHGVADPGDLGKSDPIAAPGSPPIVIVGTTRDPATPYESATQPTSAARSRCPRHAGRGRPRRLSPGRAPASTAPWTGG